ncbi:DNRLRE domain-containing protein [Chondromyces crocatus]|uniref:Carbohydrate-binding module family 96 domain-containing protein n=1 Tax=Chondromyces crocatus TaxID=52 RepID=A0A0K1EQG0_CHOCO|nr:DNRLRE domain-containing protein [Chondromyces crocatus]AKT43155.1 uncharacterized protein CMC5_073850 [Chondromyces crocatus]
MSIRMLRFAAGACVSMAMVGGVGCVGDTEEGLEDEKELVATDDQALSTDGQVCIQVQQGVSGSVQDATLWQSAPTWNDGVNERVSTGTSVAGGYSRSLLRFDLSGVPAGATVTSADLTLHQLFKNGASATVDVLRVTGAWSDSTVTWNNFGGAIDGSPVASFTAVGGGGSGSRTVDVRALAQDWVSGTVSNYGVAIDAPSDSSRSEFRSSENLTTSERPLLALCYTTCDDGVQNGEETGIDCGGSQCEPCNGQSGGSFSYSASNTSSATVNTVNHAVTIAAGQTINVGTCSVPGASVSSGDTFLRLYDGNGIAVAGNDDACGLASYFSYTVPPGAGGSFVIRAGCYSQGSCGGTVAYTVQ